MERIPVSFDSIVRITSMLILIGCWAKLAAAQDPNQDEQAIVSVNTAAYKLKTLGGKQFWTDNHHCGGWRIQENAISGHFRLIDANNRRHISGDRDQCLAKLNELKADGTVLTSTGRVVIVLHGLIRTTDSMRQLGRYLQDSGDFSAVDFEYASTRKPVAYHAEALAKVIDSLDDQVTEINFVAHSMGNIVVRHYLADLKRAGKNETRFGRMVMIGPPNNGSKMARIMRWSLIFNVVAGTAGYELGKGWSELEARLTTPEFEFGIIAGGQTGNQKFSNFFLAGKDDFTVSVEEAKLAGATDFMVKPLMHATMMRQVITLESTHRFLNHGYFLSADKRNPIEPSGSRYHRNHE